MTQRFILRGKLPSNNDFIRANRSGPQAGNAFKEKHQGLVAWEIRAARLTPIAKPVRIHYRFFEGSMRRDGDNIFSFAAKVIQDALVETGVLPQDNRYVITGFTSEFFLDRKNPRIEIELEEIE